MSGHMDQMASPRGQFAEPDCTGDAQVRCLRRFHGMNIIMIGARKRWIAFYDRFQQGHEFLRDRFRTAVFVPIDPPRRIHHGSGSQRLSMQIIRISLRHLFHGSGIRLVEWLT